MICKICKSSTEIYGVCDFNKNCEERFGFFLPLSGESVYYHQCTSCGCIQTDYCDNWTSDDYARRIYNSDYGVVDPEWKVERPTNNAEIVRRLFQPCSVIDFGGGSGEFSKILNTHGFSAVSYDPYYDQTSIAAKADLVTCFEVFEHTSRPHDTLVECMKFMHKHSTLFFSTLAIDTIGLKHRAMDAAADASYISPRNGHITIHTTKSVKSLCEAHGLVVTSLDGRFFTARFGPTS
jgi:2-polyprenyl-6-hydroxyphenyl methylase/3-demethylubiquinone-9 3-methyltransferase